MLFATVSHRQSHVSLFQRNIPPVTSQTRHSCFSISSDTEGLKSCAIDRCCIQKKFMQLCARLQNLAVALVQSLEAPLDFGIPPSLCGREEVAKFFFGFHLEILRIAGVAGRVTKCLTSAVLVVWLSLAMSMRHADAGLADNRNAAVGCH